MVVGDVVDLGNVVNSSEEVIEELVTDVGRIGLWLDALGIIVILWITFQVVNFFLNRRKRHAIYGLNKRLDKIEKKLDRVLKKKK